jgi:phosphonoacetate hydrolase
MHDVVQALADRLTSPDLAHIVDLVAYPAPGGGPDGEPAIVVAHRDGAVLLTVVPAGQAPAPHRVLRGRDPLAVTDPLAFLPYPQEQADPSPPNERNAYPDPAGRLASFFADADRSPDLVIVHTPGHYFPEQGGHRGEHGSLDVVQSRAPFLLSGAGVPRSGVISGSARTVDVAPTLLHLAGVPAAEHRDAAGAPLDGAARSDLASPGARHVIGVLWDGAHCSDLLHLAQAGQLPAVARLLDRGLALTGGAVAQFPSVTLCNHTSLLTGLGPGRHGIIGNVFYDRRLGQRVLANDETTWHRSADWLRPEVRTVFETLTLSRPGATTACINEAIDRGAGYSTMQLIRDQGDPRGPGSLQDALPPAADSPYLTDPAHLSDDYYSWCTQVDDAGLVQALGLWQEVQQAPDLMWWSHIVTDAGHHAGGPRSAIARSSLREADARLGVFLDHLDGLGVLDDVAFLLTADHGFERADETVTGSWAAAVGEVCAAHDVTHRDEGPGFIYLDVPPG